MRLYLHSPAFVVGYIGTAVIAVTLAVTLGQIWLGGDADGSAFRWMISLIAASAAFSAISLLLLLSGRRSELIRLTLVATIVVVAGFLVMILTVIWADDSQSEGFWRFFGIVAILAALGLVVTPVAALLVRDEPRARPEAPHAPAGISSDLAHRLTAAAAVRGISVEALVAPLLSETPDTAANSPAVTDTSLPPTS